MGYIVPSLQGQPLTQFEFANWIKAAEEMPTVSFNEAKTKWIKKKNQLT